MKKTLIALGTLAAFVGAASAQSNVTLFGIVDQSFNSVKNGSTSTKSMQSNQLSSNRLGFRGEEDLGGGMKAAFWLEAPMTTQDGVAGSLNFTRRSTVSLMGNFGELRVGRDYNPQFWNTVFGDVNGANGIGEGLNLIDTSLGSGATSFARSNNGIYYFLPAGLGGLYGHFGFSQENKVVTSTTKTGNAHRSARIGYASGPLEVAVAFGRTDVNTKTGFTSESFNVFNVMANYNFGPAKLYSFYNRNTFAPAKQSVYEISAGIPVASGEFRLSYGKADASGLAAATVNGVSRTDGTATLFGTSYVHNLSKRSMVYVGYGRISNSGNAAFRVLATDGSALNTTSTGMNVGVRHAF